MKTYLYITLFIFLVGALILPCQQVRAQTLADTTNVVSGDTLIVAWATTGWGVRTNALRDAINSDTAVGGARKDLNRTYKLKTDGLYYEVDDITNSGFPLVIVGEPNIPTGHYPPMIQMLALRPDGTSSAEHILTAANNITLRNIWISGRNADNGTQGASYQPLLFNANNHTYIIDGCVFERSNFSLVVFGGTNCECYVTNNKFRNLEEHPPTQQWSGRGISIWADQDTVVIENNTFFNVGFATFQMEGGSAKYLRYNHNTLVNVGRGIMSNSGNWWQNAYFANNLVINGWWEGEGYGDMHTAGRDARQTYSGLFGVGVLPAVYGTEQSRRVVMTKTYAYLDPLITAKYGTSASTDTITRAWFIDPVSVADYVTPYSLASSGGHMVISDTNWLSSLPTGMTNYLYDANWNTNDQPLTSYSGTASHMVDSMWKFITEVRSGSNMYTEFFYHPTDYTATEWPLPENFTYSTSDPLYTAGTDGLPIGDLNYFPTKKTAFYAQQSNFIKQIEALAGQVVIDSIKSTLEAEDGGIGGTAVVDKFTGFSYFNMGSGGYIQWTFTLPTAGQYGLNIWTNLDNQDMRGQNFLINGVAIHDVIGWGELEFCSTQHSHTASEWRGPCMNLDDNSWIWAYYPKDSILAADQSKLAFVAGTNTIKITPSWGYQDFAGIDLIAVGATIPSNTTVTGAQLIKSLRAPDATSSIVTPHGSGAPWIPSLFKSVKLGTAGTDTLMFVVASAGNYRFRLFGQNYNSTAQTITIKEGSTTLVSPALPKLKADTTGVDVLSSVFAWTAGTHTIVLSGGASKDVWLDQVQLVKENVQTGVEAGQRPIDFALEQNYPNPFNPSTTINFTLGKASNVKLSVYNVLGQKVATLVDSHMNAGRQSVVFDASRFASGVYFYRLDAGSNFNSVKKMLLLK
ncbi:MAG: T9SS type A sorting domain-containing protein [Bacteroidota bacterium]|jgi:hypothetical protein